MLPQPKVSSPFPSNINFHVITQASFPTLLNVVVSSWPILAVYCVRLSHAITFLFSKYFQILYIFAQIFKYFVLFELFLCSFSEKSHPCSYFAEETLIIFLTSGLIYTYAMLILINQCLLNIVIIMAKALNGQNSPKQYDHFPNL